jgi:two-component system, chemotaxis family, sensor kinase CheA
MSDTHTSESSGDVFDLSQFHGVFYEEAGENLTNMEALLLDTDESNADDESLNAIFRCAHSIKGGAATFGFQDVADLTHVMETLLDRLRRRELAITSGMIDTLLESGDVLKHLLASRQSGTDPGIDCTELVARIGAFAHGTVAAPVAVPVTETPAPAATSVVAAPTVPGERVLEIAIGPLDQPKFADNVVELFSEIPGLGTIEPTDDGQPDASKTRHFRVVSTVTDSDLLDLFSFHVSREQVSIRELGAAPAPALAPTAAHDADPTFGLFDDLPVPVAIEVHAPEALVAAASKAEAPRSADRSAPASANLESSTIRVPTEKVDQLINLVGEMVITQAMLAQTGRGLDAVVHQAMATALTDLERNTRLLQEAVMAIRMIPMTAVFNRFPRMLRDLSGRLGKKLELHTIGEDTELDKGLIEKITDPLTHLVRNSADHGIEMPADRIAAGKPEHGTVTLAAAHQGGSIVIEVRDDGRGLNRGKLLAKARERGLSVSDSMTDTEVYGLIFAPGFSTATEVTDVSGRGVGMDVVKRNITSLGGSVEIDSVEGQGMRVSVRLPLTLAIMDGMSVGVADETYIVPLASVVESIHMSASDVKSVGGTGRVVEVRNEYLPLMRLDELFDVPRSVEHSGGIMIVVEAEGGRIALLVDDLIGQHQVVVKNLEANYRKVPGVSGATILGDGRVALILDVSWLVRRVRH